MSFDQLEHKEKELVIQYLVGYCCLPRIKHEGSKTQPLKFDTKRVKETMTEIVEDFGYDDGSVKSVVGELSKGWSVKFFPDTQVEFVMKDPEGEELGRFTDPGEGIDLMTLTRSVKFYVPDECDSLIANIEEDNDAVTLTFQQDVY